MTRGRVGSANAATLTLVCLAACATLHQELDVPAVIVNSTPEARGALAQAISTVLHGTPVTFADDALTRASTLIVEPVRPRVAGGIPLQGRELRSPEHFSLVKRGSTCLLVHERTRRRLTLAGIECAPL